jgi:hypothetical protein
MSRSVTVLLALFAFAFSAAAIAQNAAPTAEQISQWIKDLDSDDFATRERATTSLAAAGRAAIDPVAKAAEGESLEVTSRCLDVLAKLHDTKDAETKSAAQKALEGLSKSKNAAAAHRAEEILRPEKLAEPAAAPALPFGAPPPAPFGGRVIIGGFGVAGPGMKVSVRNEGGDKTIEAEEAGKKIKIQEKAKGEIKMQVTETVDGKEKTSTYEAKNAGDLKKNHAEAHKLYEKYSKFGGAGMIMPAGPPGIGGGAIMPFGPGGAGAIRVGIIPQKALDQIEEARKEMQRATDDLKKLAGESRIDPERVKKLAEQIDGAKQKLEEAQKQLGK